MVRQQKTKSGFDLWLLGAFLALILIGVAVLSSAGTAIGYQTFNDSYYFIKHQILKGLLPGLVFFFALMFTNHQIWKKIAPVFLFISIGLLLLVFIPGLGLVLNNAKSWVNLGQFYFQPAEIVKLLFIIYLAAWLSKQPDDKIKSFSYGFLPFILLIGIIALLMILQPDIGTLSVILFSSCCIYFVRGANWKHVLLLLGLGITAFVALVKLAPYRADRLMTFLHPELDPQGIGYHINQAFLAIGSGGFWGRGFGLSRQKFQYLPETTGDSIFAVFAEELGFIFSVLLIALFIFIAFRIYKIIKEQSDPFAKLL
jgi:cell division protein FtsW